MSKSKSKKKAQNQKMTPERYIKERSRKLPVWQCYINDDWQLEGMAEVVVVRKKPDGNFVIGVYLVDTYCLGVKDCFCNNDLEYEELQEALRRTYSDGNMKEISYDEVHNLIYGAIAFAEDAGIPPVKDFALAKYVLEEDTEDIPLIEYEYGKDGKYFLICGEAYSRDKLFIEPLKKRLGNEFDYIVPYEMPSFDSENFPGLAALEESRRFPREEYSYMHPEYPIALSVKNQFIVSAFYDPEHAYTMPEDVIERILSLPADEAAGDISRLIMFEIGRTYKQIEEGEAEDVMGSPLLHSVIFLAHIDSDRGLDAILEILRQTEDFADYHFGDLALEYIYQALYMAGKNNTGVIEKYLNEPGYASYLRIQAVYALAMIASNHPERRPEIIAIFRRLLVSMTDRLPRQEACDATFAGFVMSVMEDISAKELIPEIKTVFATDCVDKMVAGDADSVISEINNPDSMFIDKREPMTIEDQYRHLESFDNK